MGGVCGQVSGTVTGSRHVPSFLVLNRSVGVYDADVGVELLRVERVQGHQVQLRETDMTKRWVGLVGGA